MEATLEQSSVRLAQIEAMRSQTEAARAESEVAVRQATELIASAKGLSDQIVGEQARLNVFRETVEQREAQIQASSAELEKITVAIGAKNDEIANLVQRANALLSHATSVGLAAAFRSEAQTRSLVAIFSLSSAILLLVGMAYVLWQIANTVYGHASSQQGLDDIQVISQIILRIGILIPLGFGVGILAKHLAVNRYVQEEYAHKASLSTALEGYRTLLPEGDQQELVKTTMEKMYRNPAERLDASADEGDLAKRAKEIVSLLKDIIRSGSAQKSS
jgi:hypothetical protein